MKATILATLIALSSAAQLDLHLPFWSELKSLGFNVTIPSDPGYAYVSKPFNLRITTRPLAVTIPHDSNQVAAVVRVAAKYNHKVTVKSGGHAYNAGGLGGGDRTVVVDLRNFNTIQFDRSSNRATIGPASWLINVTETLVPHRRALPHGACPAIGAGGHAAFGGYGFMSKKHGLFLDRILGVEVVLSNGTIAWASKFRNSDLFWALRGSAPSFGIVTSLVAETVPMPESATLFSYGWTLTPSKLSKVIDNIQRFTLGQSASELSGVYVISPGPRRGTVSLSLTGAFFDDPSKFESAVVSIVKNVPGAYERTVNTTMSYLEVIRGLAQYSWAPHSTLYAKSLITPADSPMNGRAREKFASYLANDAHGANINWFVHISPFGGPSSGVSQVSPDETSFAHRDGLLLMQFHGSTFNETPPFPPEGLHLLNGMVNRIIEHSPGNWNYGTYANYPDPRLEDWQRAYWGNHYRRLQQLKTEYDPRNTFSFHQSIAA
ncbi:glucooligosaccharide oxidase [Coprinopsis sp. MPI-PUGE-AT-0042]|nr:glucooligosaccharide oxidase [Coprinopsis sp. MPI-PUGE-AT-0042]